MRVTFACRRGFKGFDQGLCVALILDWELQNLQ
jgi:hypothetical protein